MTKAMTHNSLSPPVFPHAWASAWGQDQFGLWQAFTYKNIRHVFRWIPPGRFMMGSPENNEEGRYDWEDMHPVTLSKGFWLGETTVTQALWKAVMDGATPSHFKGDERPVEQVNWHDCQQFINKLRSLHPDLQVRLPWEAEWEYACRAGTETPFHFGGKDDLSTEKANYSGKWDAYDSSGSTRPVKSYPPNNWGLYEMHGNVWEWCEDVWQRNLGKDAVIDPQGRADSESEAGRVIRGGAWVLGGWNCRSAYRNGHEPAIRNGHLGLRLSLGH